MAMIDFGTLEEELLAIQAMNADATLLPSPSPSPTVTPTPTPVPQGMATYSPAKPPNFDLSNSLELAGSVTGNFVPPAIIPAPIKSGVLAGAGQGLGQVLENALYGGTNKHILEDSLASAGWNTAGNIVGGVVAKPFEGALKATGNFIGEIPAIGPAFRKVTQSGLSKLGNETIDSIDDVGYSKVIGSEKKSILDSAQQTRQKLYDLAENVAGEKTFPANNVLNTAEDLAANLQPGVDPTGLSLKGEVPRIVKNLQEAGGVYNYKQLSTAWRELNDYIPTQQIPGSDKLTADGMKAVRLKNALKMDLDEYANSENAGKALKRAHNAANKFHGDDYVPLVGKTANKITRAIDESPEKLVNKVINSEVSIDKVEKVIGATGMEKLSGMYKKNLFKQSSSLNTTTKLREVDPNKLLQQLSKNENISRKMLGSDYDQITTLAYDALKDRTGPAAKALTRTVGSLLGAAAFHKPSIGAPMEQAGNVTGSNDEVLAPSNKALSDDDVLKLLGEE